MEQELKKIYDSEINVKIESYWDADWRVAIMVRGEWVRPKWDMCDLNQVIPALQELIKEHLPTSHYAKSLPPNQ